MPTLSYYQVSGLILHDKFFGYHLHYSYHQFL